MTASHYLGLRFFNGRLQAHPAYGRNLHGYIVAHSKAEAIRLAEPTDFKLSQGEFRNFWCEAWGNPATLALGTPERPSFWASDNRDQTWHLISLMHEGKVLTGPELLRFILSCLPS